MTLNYKFDNFEFQTAIILQIVKRQNAIFL